MGGSTEMCDLNAPFSAFRACMQAQCAAPCMLGSRGSSASSASSSSGP
jgi:hypothetical protein